MSLKPCRLIGGGRRSQTLCLLNGSSGHDAAVVGLAAAGGPQGVVWSGSRDCTRVWHAYRRNCIMEVKRCVDMRCCAVSGDESGGEYVWTGHGDGSIIKWRAGERSHRGRNCMLLGPRCWS